MIGGGQRIAFCIVILHVCIDVSCFVLNYSGVTKQGFEGCIENLALQLATWDLNLNKKAKGVSPGCPEQVSYVSKPFQLRRLR